MDQPAHHVFGATDKDVSNDGDVLLLREQGGLRREAAVCCVEVCRCDHNPPCRRVEARSTEAPACNGRWSQWWNSSVLAVSSSHSKCHCTNTFRSPRPLFVVYKPFELSKPFECPSVEKECVAVGLAVTAFILYWIGQLYSLVFPFVSFIMFFDRQNLLQKFCFYATAATTAFFFVLLPYSYQYVWFCLETKCLWRSVASSEFMKMDLISQVVQDYHVPPQHYLLRLAIPGDLLPTDVVGVVASLMRRGDLDMSSLSIKQCRDIKERMIDPIDVPADDEQAAVVIRQSSSFSITEASAPPVASDAPPRHLLVDADNDAVNGADVDQDETFLTRQISDVEPR